MIRDKTVVLGVCGGIAAYKAADITSRLKKLGINVRICMTKSAQQFITPLTLQTLSQNTVAYEMFDLKKWEIDHISLSDDAGVMLIVPATANVIGKIAGGIADDIVTTTVMAVKGRVIIAPAMNSKMYENPVVQRNISSLKALGYQFIEPEEGRLACGIIGKGKLADADTIVEAVVDALTEKDLEGMKVVVTAGPTCEKIDDVRYITNHSTGKMGIAIALAAKRRGAFVTLICGKVSVKKPDGVNVIDVFSAEDMYNAVMDAREDADIIVKAAAVGDFYVKNQAGGKAKKDSFKVLELEKNKDILEALGKDKKYKLIGFSMDTSDVAEEAARKLSAKNADLIVANDLTQKGAGFGADTNIVKIIYPNGKTEELPLMTKSDVANEILDRCLRPQ